MNNFSRNDFNNLVRFLRDNGYRVKTETCYHSFTSTHEVTGEFAVIRDKNIVAGFVWVKNDPEQFYPYIADKMAVDHADCFDKWSKCAMIVKLPANHNDILKWLKIMGTKQAFEKSNIFERIPGVPYEYKNGWF